MPFGLRNASRTFQRLMDEVLRGLPFCYAYIDKVLVASSNADEHKLHLRQVCERLTECGIKVNPAKCDFGVPELDFLWYRVTSQGIYPLQKKVQAIQEFPQPTTLHKLREFLGLVNFYHRFIPGCSRVLRLLNNMLASS